MAFSDEVRVQQLLGLRRYEEARDLARQSLVEAPEDAYMISQLATAERELSGDAEALKIIERAIALDHGRASYHAQRAYYLSHLGRHEEADEGFVEALTMDPTNSFALTARVEAIIRDPRSAKRRTKSERLGAARYCADSMLSNYPNSATSHLMDAKVRLANNDFDGCDASASQALRLEPDNAVGHQLIGLAAEAKGDTRKAGDAFVSAQRADPTSSTGLEGLRRLGKGAAAPIGFIVFLLLRTGVRAGRATGSALAAVLIIAAVGTAAYYVHQRRKEKALSKADLSSDARAILDQDEKFS